MLKRRARSYPTLIQDPFLRWNWISVHLLQIRILCGGTGLSIHWWVESRQMNLLAMSPSQLTLVLPSDAV